MISRENGCSFANDCETGFAAILWQQQLQSAECRLHRVHGVHPPPVPSIWLPSNLCAIQYPSLFLSSSFKVWQSMKVVLPDLCEQKLCLIPTGRLKTKERVGLILLKEKLNDF